jgi:hypothetical protein
VSEKNDRIVREILPFHGTHVLHCECGRDDCTQTLTVHEDEHRLARRRRGHLVAYDHCDKDRERRISGNGEASIVVPRDPTGSTSFTGARGGEGASPGPTPPRRAPV